ncbi:NADPH-dependent FMN reductase [Methanosalsum zhilinae DSM 4017]|uniref:NADPH-dependent FMN reductase n=1 Tax=Methanosalsum zhilinae (strain DSM 4017 / NBRC 107636 / OCM 62 / WeN5) TaxID=679901 RepID=F7XLY4_METZD|nr:flavodoxin family protein [Methanosalsum zhilinae]AEH60912.1 NADPH-dependent FMN reductase [Methanosalsum zhilinae DSM 4017]
MKITIFNGSPRGRKSNSNVIAESLLEGAELAGAQTEQVFLIEKDIKQCLGCFSCWEKTPGSCILNDDMKELINLYLESDYVGMATPVYNMYMTGLLKNFTDRFLPLVTPHLQRKEDGSFYHEGRVKHFPRQFFIANSGFPGEHNFDVLKKFFENQNLVLEIYRDCGEALQATVENPSLIEKINQYREHLKKAGSEIVQNGQVCGETKDQIHSKLIRDEEYMEEANRQWNEMLEETDC